MSNHSNLSSEEVRVLEDFNKFRAAPTQFESLFSLVSKAYANIPRKKESAELNEVIKGLAKIPALKELSLSEGLCKVAKSETKKILNAPLHNIIKLDKDELIASCKLHVSGFTEVIQILDQGSIDNIIARCMVHDNDPIRAYKKALLSTNYTHIGLSIVEVEGEQTSIIIMANNISEGRKFDPKDYPEIKEAFDLFDANGYGKIDIKETKKAMLDLAFHIKNPVIYSAIDSLDTEENYLGVDFDTLMLALVNNFNDETSRDGLYKIFCLYRDNTHDDIISLNGLKALLKDLEESELLKELETIEKLATAGNKVLTFDDFHRVFTPQSTQ